MLKITYLDVGRDNGDREAGKSVDTEHALRHVLCLTNLSGLPAAKWASFDRTASVKRLPNGIRDVPKEPRMATLAQRKANQLTTRAVINAFSVPLNKTASSPIGGRLGAKEAQSARPDCTLPFCATSQRAANDGAMRRAA